MQRIRELFQSFFQIREALKGSTSAILGVAPIFLLFLLWFMVTRGSFIRVTLPVGTLDKGEPQVVPGRQVKWGVCLDIPGADLIFIEKTDQRFIKVGEENFEVKLFAKKYDDKVSVRLVDGRFIAKNDAQSEMRASPTASGAMALPSNEGEVSQNTLSLDGKKPPSGYIGRGGQKVQARKIPTLEFEYEMVETRLLPATILPSPGDALRSFPSLWREKGLFRNIWASFKRVLYGFLLALSIAFPLGILMGSFSKVRAMFSPLMVFSGYLPIPTLVPLSIAFFSISETQKITFLALAFGIYLLPLIVKAIEEIDNVYLQTAYTLGANRFQVMTKVLLGIALPNIYDAMRLGFGVGWTYIMLAEMADLKQSEEGGGIGALLLLSQRRGYVADIYLILVVIVGLAYLTDRLWEYVGDKVFPYRRLKR